MTSFDPEKTRQFYDRVSRFYDALADASEHAARELGIEGLAPVGRERILEIGSGTGRGLLAIAERLSDEGRVFGVDLSPGMIAVARRAVEESSVGHRVAELKEADARDLPYRDDFFDAAFASFTLELFPDEDIPRVLAEIRRVLAAEGRLGVVAMLDDGSQGPMVELYGFLHRHFPHIIDCRPVDVHGVLVKAGFRILGSEKLSLWGLPVAVVTAGLERETSEESRTA